MKKATTLTCIVLLALLCAPFPAGAADRRPRITHEFAERVFVKSWRTNTYDVLSYYDFTYSELHKLKELLEDNAKHPPSIGDGRTHIAAADNARNVVKMIIEDILCELKYDAILIIHFIEQSEENKYDCYYWIKMPDGRKKKIYAVFWDVIFDGRMHRPMKGDILKLYVKKTKGWPPNTWKLVKMFYPDDGKPHRTPMQGRHNTSAPSITDWEIRQLREKVLRNRVILDPELLPGEQAWPPSNGADFVVRDDLPSWITSPWP